MDFFIFNLIHDGAGRIFFADVLAVFLARYLPYLLVFTALFFVFRFKPVKEKIFVFATLALNVILSRGIITEVIRFLYDRPRPYETLEFEPLFRDLNPSFPSGHAAFFFALALAVFSFDRRWGSWFLVFSLIVGAARIFAGVHWPTDILGGAAVAALSYFAVKKILVPYRAAAN